MGNSQNQGVFVAKVARLIDADRTSSLATLWKKLDEKARADLISFIEFYIGRRSDDPVLDSRRQRIEYTQKAVRKQIASLQKTQAARVEFEMMECKPHGKIATFGDPFWPAEYGPLSRILSTEISRLDRLLKKIKVLSNMKRLGIARNHTWLLRAQQYVHHWTAAHLGRPSDLSPTQLADLIDFTKSAAGQTGQELTNPEDIQKAIRNFRQNPSNKTLCELIDREFKPEL